MPAILNHCHRNLPFLEAFAKVQLLPSQVDDSELWNPLFQHVFYCSGLCLYEFAITRMCEFVAFSQTLLIGKDPLDLLRLWGTTTLSSTTTTTMVIASGFPKFRIVSETVRNHSLSISPYIFMYIIYYIYMLYTFRYAYLLYLIYKYSSCLWSHIIFSCLSFLPSIADYWRAFGNGCWNAFRWRL